MVDKPGDAGCKNCLPMFRSPECVTQIHVVQAIGLRRDDDEKGLPMTRSVIISRSQSLTREIACMTPS